MVAEILRLIGETAVVAHAQKEIAVAGLHDAAAEMSAVGERAVLAEDHLDVGEPGRAFVHQLGARQRGARAAVHRIGIAEIDRMVVAIAAVESHIEQPALARREDFRHPGKRRRDFAVLADDANAPRPLRDQQAAIRQEG